ncbi:MAG TPA: diaminopimelate decarboxylase [Gammaproteobacteria bacterium]|nr:diaminopimelate decarboxylase [Gammaproteobacteria bacterium]
MRRDGALVLEDVPLAVVAERYGTPCYVYSRAALTHAWCELDALLAAHPHQICYAVKANSNLAVLGVLAALGSGFDIVSVGELERALRAGADPKRVVFAGVGKRHDELERALEVGVGCFNVESEPELERLDEVARAHGRRAPVALRINPDVDARTHPYIATGLASNKFGIPVSAADAAYRRASDCAGLEVTGIACHIGSQLLDVQPFADALARVLELVDRLASAGMRLEHIDMGGGLGIRYRDETPPTAADYARALLTGMSGRGERLLLEPGRSIVGNAGLLLTRVEYLKQGEDRSFLICDAAMNDLIRPALYSAWQDILEVAPIPGAPARRVEVVGPVCETGDFLGRERQLSAGPGELLAIASAGAYGFVMASNYNSRPRAAEVMVDGDAMHLVRERESLADLMRGERLLPGACGSATPVGSISL